MMSAPGGFCSYTPLSSRFPEAAVHIRLALALSCLLALFGMARAEEALEIIPLQNRTADEVLPSLLPLLEPGGVLTGVQGNLILRASQSNRAQIKQALAALDVAPRQLRITVRQSLDRTGEQESFALHGKLETGAVEVVVPPGAGGGVQVEVGSGKARIGARLDDRSLDQVSRVSQHVRVADGGRALIQASMELPLTLREIVLDPYGRTVRESIVYYSVGSGFYVAPQVVGDRVTLDIHPVQQTFASASPKVIVGQELRTTVTGRLGEWIALGGGDVQEQQDDRRLLGQRRTESREARQVWLKVEVVD